MRNPFHTMTDDQAQACRDLMLEADEYLRAIRAENLDGSEPALADLLDRILSLNLRLPEN